MIRAILLSSAALLTVAAMPQDAFVDHFRTLDSSRWSVSDRWSDGAAFLSDWRKGQLTLGHSGLTITLDKNSASKNGYSSGEFRTKKTYKYGYYEARMTAAAGPGLDTGFFTYIGPTQGQNWNEIDVEILGKNTRAVQLTYHVGNQQQATTISLPFDSATSAHTFGFDWQPQYIKWYIDGKLVHTETGAALPLPTEPQLLMVNLWNSSSFAKWMGAFNWPGHPVSARITCVGVSPQFTGQIC